MTTALPTSEKKRARFWDRVDSSAGPEACWPWTGKGQRYGRLGFRGTTWFAHRVAWVLTNGEIPDGMVICHRCDFPYCCNPSHLFLGTPADNVADMVSKGRQAKGDTHMSRTHPERLRRGDDHPARQRRAEWAARIRHIPRIQKLSDAEVAEVRMRAAAGARHRDLAAAFSVSCSLISAIVTGRRRVAPQAST